MADYYSILKKTISGLNNNKPELRQAVYAKARNAIENQLRKLEPTPGEEAIAAQLRLLEEAIAVIESEYQPPETLQDTEIEIDAIEVVSPQSTPVSPAAPPNAPPPSAPQSSVSPPSIEPEPVVTATTATPTTSVAEPVMAQPADEITPEMPEPTVAPLPSEPALSQEAAPVSAAETVNVAGVPDELVEQAGPKKKLPIVPAVTIVTLLAVLGGAGYAAWSYREAISDTVASLTGGSATSEQGQSQSEVASDEPEAPAAIEETNTGDDKDDDRLGTNETEQTVEPQEEVAAATEQQPVAVLPEETAASSSSETEPAVENAEENLAAENQQQTAVPVPLGEVAYLYEEGGAGSGATRANASVTWSSVQLKPSESLPAEPVIVGNMEIPEKGLSVEINIKRNVDEALSASHIIEITFDVPSSFSGGSIDNIARFVMKPTEEARGEPLVAVPVKVSDGYFLVALDNLEQAVEVNTQLMENSRWIDIPITYTSGKRALLTLEKGGTGTQAFTEALEGWKNL